MSEFLTYKLFEVGNYVITVGTLLSVLLIFIGTRFFIVFLTRAFTRMATRRKMDRGRQYSFLLLMRYFIWIFAISLILHAIGVNLTFLIASSAALLVGSDLRFMIWNAFKENGIQIPYSQIDLHIKSPSSGRI
jgi:small-conductance mechanosensitive channel